MITGKEEDGKATPLPHTTRLALDNFLSLLRVFYCKKKNSLAPCPLSLSSMVVSKHASDYARKPYSGLSRSLVIAIDVGTTFSGVRDLLLSYPLIAPVSLIAIRRSPTPSSNLARYPKFTESLGSFHLHARMHGINACAHILILILIVIRRFPGQEHVAGNSKIPSIIYYDRHGSIMVAGAEADSSAVVAQAEDEGWIKTELYVPRSSSSSALPYPCNPLSQIQTTSPTSHDAAQHERHASDSTPQAQDARTRFR